jgi:hypothetical protein
MKSRVNFFILVMNLNSNLNHHQGQNQASKSAPHIFTSGTFELAWKFTKTPPKI